MAPQTSIPPAANALGTAGTVCWCIQLVPQIYQNWRKKNTDGLPSAMMLTWASSSVPLGAYLIIQNENIPIQIQAQIFCLLTLITWTQVMVYSYKWRPSRVTIVAIGLGMIFGGLEALLVFTIRIPYRHGVEWPVILLGVISGVLLLIGLFLPYREMAKRRGRVIGIDFLFLFIDWLGAVFSFLSIAVQNSFDILASILYVLVIVLEAGIFISHWIWLYRFRELRREVKATGKSFEELSDVPMERELPVPGWLKIMTRPFGGLFSKISRVCKGPDSDGLQEHHEPGTEYTAAVKEVSGDIT